MVAQLKQGEKKKNSPPKISTNGEQTPKKISIAEQTPICV
jgi:hypothetical protein